MTTLRTLTLHQPWATLVALGVKTIETRSWRTHYRGPVAIHAGARQPDLGLEIGPFRVTRGTEGWHISGPEPVYGYARLPLGAIVATATLIDVVPMIDDDTITTAPYLRLSPSGTLALRTQDAPEQRSPLDVSDQAPYGDYAPGRYAWLLTDIEPCDPIPAKGKQGLWTWDGDAA